MPSSEPERPEYEDRVVRHLRRTLIEGGLRVFHRGVPVEFEEARLEAAGSEESSVVVTFRTHNRPGCLFGRRNNAVGPPQPLQEPQRDAPEEWADMIWITLMEDIETGPTLLKRCDPESTTWI